MFEGALASGGKLTIRSLQRTSRIGYRYILQKKEGRYSMAIIDQEIAKLLHRLPEAQQQRALDFARELAEVKRFWCKFRWLRHYKG
jgi:hypothetical protein